MALWQFPLFIYFTSIHNPVALSRFCLYTPALAPVASHHWWRGRGDQVTCRARPRTLPSHALPSSPICYTSNISITDMRSSSALLHHDTRKLFLIFSLSLSLLNSVWKNFKKKGGSKYFLSVSSHFPQSAHRELAANLMKALIAQKCLQTN